jgi:hypothetical protein
MDEILEEVSEDTVVNDVIVEDTPQVSQVEQEARDQGWKPKEEWKGDPDKWRPAKEFVDRGELYSKIDTMGKELKDTKRALQMLQEHHSKVKETEYKKAVEELKSLQKKHLEEGNSDGYLETTEILSDLRAEQKARQVVQEVTPAKVDPRFTDWVEANKWYDGKPEMRQYADIIGQGYAKQNPGIDPTEVLKYVTNEVKQKYRDFFQNPNRDKPNSVESGTRSVSSGTKFELNDDERRVMNTFIRQGIIGPMGMSKEEYIKEVKLSKGIK